MSIVLDQAALNTDLAASSALSTLHWAQQEFGKDLCLLSSMQDAVLIDLAMQVSPAIDIVFLDLCEVRRRGFFARLVSLG